MEKLQLKMRMLNVAATEDTWKAFDLVMKFWQKLDVKDEAAAAGAVLSAGVSEIVDGIVKINTRDPEMLDKLKDIKIDKGGINEMYDVTI